MSRSTSNRSSAFRTQRRAVRRAIKAKRKTLAVGADTRAVTTVGAIKKKIGAMRAPRKTFKVKPIKPL